MITCKTATETHYHYKFTHNKPTSNKNHSMISTYLTTSDSAIKTTDLDPPNKKQSNFKLNFS